MPSRDERWEGTALHEGTITLIALALATLGVGPDGRLGTDDDVRGSD